MNPTKAPATPEEHQARVSALFGRVMEFMNADPERHLSVIGPVYFTLAGSVAAVVKMPAEEMLKTMMLNRNQADEKMINLDCRK